jgi:tyrosyl-tRNA synthetase
MAREIVTAFRSQAEAQEAEEAFKRQFSERKLPTNIPDYHLSEPTNIINFMVDARMVASKSEARRLIQQGGVSYYADGESSEAERINSLDWTVPVRDGAILKVGKLQYIRIKAQI